MFELFKKKRPFCTAVIVAAGNSTRMQQDKTTMLLQGKSVVERTLSVFESCGCIDEVVLVTKAESIEALADLVKESGFKKVSKVVCGGKTRTESCLAGCMAANRKAKLIAIHDGARPFVTEDIIQNAVETAEIYKNVAPAIKGADTLRVADDEFVTAELDRDSVVKIQTPQVFDADVIKGALSYVISKDIQVTDDCSAVALLGFRTKLIPGDADNIKLTTPKDLKLAQMILQQRGEA